MTYRTATLLVAALALAGCASKEPATQAATTPLSDLNVVRAEIPAVLTAAQKSPYAPPADKSCIALAADVQVLDALRSAAEGVIPFRGWVRGLTGAVRDSREVAAAIAAGTIRPAYLKGLGAAAGCTAPASPRAG